MDILSGLQLLCSEWQQQEKECLWELHVHVYALVAFLYGMYMYICKQMYMKTLKSRFKKLPYIVTTTCLYKWCVCVHASGGEVSSLNPHAALFPFH